MVQWQTSLFAVGPLEVDPGADTERVALDEHSWVDVTRGYLHGADDLCAELAATVGWRQGRRRMYDREVDDPRLSHWYRRGDAVP